MTDLRKAVEMAVPLLIGYREYSGDHRIANRCREVLEALRQALAQPEQEPVAWMLPEYGDVLPASQADGTGIYNIPLYAAPPRKEWVGLTGEQLARIVVRHAGFPTKEVWAISEALKELNT
jgi:hypothetical protein